MAVVISPEERWPWPPSAHHLQGEDVVSSSRKPYLHKAVAHMSSVSGRFLCNTSGPTPPTLNSCLPMEDGARADSHFKAWV